MSTSKKFQPVRIPIVNEYNDPRNPGSSRKRNGLSLSKPVRIPQVPTVSTKMQVRKRLDTMYDTARPKENHMSSVVSRSVAILKDSRDNASGTTSFKSKQLNGNVRRSGLVPPGSITNKFVRKHSSIVMNKNTKTISNSTPISIKKLIRHSDIPEESSELLSSTHNSFCERRQLEESMNTSGQKDNQHLLGKTLPCENDKEKIESPECFSKSLVSRVLGNITLPNNVDKITANLTTSINDEFSRDKHSSTIDELHTAVERPSVIVTLNQKNLTESRLNCSQKTLVTLDKPRMNDDTSKRTTPPACVPADQLDRQVSIDVATLVTLESELSSYILCQERQLCGSRKILALVRSLLLTQQNLNSYSKITDTKDVPLQEKRSSSSELIPLTHASHNEICTGELTIRPIVRLQCIENVSQEDNITESESTQSTSKENGNSQNPIITDILKEGEAAQPRKKYTAKKKSPKKVQRRKTLAEIQVNGNSLEDSNDKEISGRRRSARLASKQAGLSPSLEDLSTKPIKSPSTKSKPSTPRANSRQSKWGNRTETPLREYMLLKSANKFLTTPDTRQYRFDSDENIRGDESTIPNDVSEQTILSRKLLKSLQRLYVATP